MRTPKKMEVGITVRMIHPIFKFLSQTNTFLEGGGWAELSSLSDPWGLERCREAPRPVYNDSAHHSLTFYSESNTNIYMRTRYNRMSRITRDHKKRTRLRQRQNPSSTPLSHCISCPRLTCGPSFFWSIRLTDIIGKKTPDCNFTTFLPSPTYSKIQPECYWGFRLTLIS